MKNFKYRLLYRPAGREEADSIFNELKMLGYTVDGREKLPSSYGWFIDTAYCGKRGNPAITSRDDQGQIRIDNKDTFLALAAMVDDDKFYRGEWVVTKNSAEGITDFTAGKMYLLLRDITEEDSFSTMKSDVGEENGLHVSHLRKATKEEIIEHFRSPKLRFVQVDKKGNPVPEFKPGERVKIKTAAVDTETAPLNAGWCSQMTLKHPVFDLNSKNTRDEGWYNPCISVDPLAPETASQIRFDIRHPLKNPDLILITRSKKKHSLLTF